jgi:AcrR family transcriptional regulator
MIPPGPVDTQKAWSPSEHDAEKTAMTARILDAALERFTTHGISTTTMGELAIDAGISRAWLYRNFENREAILAALAAREAQRLVAEVARTADFSLPRAERLTNAFVQIVKFLRGHALLRHVLAAERELSMTYLLEGSAPALRWGIETLALSLQAGVDPLKPSRAKRVSETMVRLIHSIVITPALGVDFDNPRELRAFATQLVHALLA